MNGSQKPTNLDKRPPRRLPPIVAKLNAISKQAYFCGSSSGYKVGRNPNIIVTIPPLMNPLIILLIQAIAVNRARFSTKFRIPKLTVPKVQNIMLMYSNFFLPKKNIILPQINDDMTAPKSKLPNMKPSMPFSTPLSYATFGKNGRGSEKVENTRKSSRSNPNNVQSTFIFAIFY